jgi:hypothetical protein
MEEEITPAVVTCGTSHSACITRRGTLYTFGLGNRGELGLGYPSEVGQWVCGRRRDGGGWHEARDAHPTPAPRHAAAQPPASCMPCRPAPQVAFPTRVQLFKKPHLRIVSIAVRPPAP